MTIPASQIVSSDPSVLGPGGLGLVLNGMFLTDSTRVPIGTISEFETATDVGTFFGPNSAQATLAGVYFAGYDNSTLKPSTMLFTQYNQTAVAAYLRGGPITQLTIAQINALPTGSLNIIMDGYTHTASALSLSSATSYSNAASIINTAINASQPTEATGSLSTIAATTLTVGGTITGTFAVGQTIAGSGVTANSIITALESGTGGAGTYTLSQSSTVSVPEAITATATPITCTFDSVSGSLVFTSGITGVPSTAAYATGALSASLFLTLASGAVISQGAAIATPSAFMNALVQLSQEWAPFTTTFDPDGGSGNAQKLLFALWTTQQNNRWNYVAWDTDASPTVSVPASASLGQLLKAGNYSGTTCIYRTLALGDANEIAAFYMGTAASIDFQRQNGRITFAFKGQSGIVPDITNATTAANLIANGYNFYGDWASATQQFLWFYPGQISGPFLWADAYLNQVWMNTTFQTDLMVLLGAVPAVPYNTRGNGLIEGSMLNTIQAGLNFGAFSPGVALSPLQQAEIINQAGLDITNALFTQGYYLQILPATAQVRAARGSPPITFWYTDAGAVQKINIASVAVQ